MLPRQISCHRARWLAPSLGVFVSPDPSEADAHSYRYGQPNPVGFIDPTGLSSLAEAGTLVHKQLGAVFVAGDPAHRMYNKTVRRLLRGYDVWWDELEALVCSRCRPDLIETRKSNMSTDLIGPPGGYLWEIKRGTNGWGYAEGRDDLVFYEAQLNIGASVGVVPSWRAAPDGRWNAPARLPIFFPMYRKVLPVHFTQSRDGVILYDVEGQSKEEDELDAEEDSAANSIGAGLARMALGFGAEAAAPVEGILIGIASPAY